MCVCHGLPQAWAGVIIPRQYTCVSQCRGAEEACSPSCQHGGSSHGLGWLEAGQRLLSEVRETDASWITPTHAGQWIGTENESETDRKTDGYGGRVRWTGFGKNEKEETKVQVRTEQTYTPATLWESCQASAEQSCRDRVALGGHHLSVPQRRSDQSHWMGGRPVDTCFKCRGIHVMPLQL